MEARDPHELLRRMKAGEASDREALDYIVEALGNAKTAMEGAGERIARLENAIRSLIALEWSVESHTPETREKWAQCLLDAEMALYQK